MSKKIVRLNEDVVDFDGRASNLTVGKLIVRQLENMPVSENPQAPATQKDFDVALRRRKVARMIQKAMADGGAGRIEKMSDEDYRLAEEAVMANKIGFPSSLMVQVIEAIRGISYEDESSDEGEDRPALEAVS